MRCCLTLSHASNVAGCICTVCSTRSARVDLAVSTALLSSTLT